MKLANDLQMLMQITIVIILGEIGPINKQKMNQASKCNVVISVLSITVASSYLYHTCPSVSQ